MNMFAEIRTRQAKAVEEFKSANFSFDKQLTPSDLSVGEIEDLLALAIGEQTYVGDIGDVVRIA